MSLFEEYSPDKRSPAQNAILKKLHIRKAKTDDTAGIAELTAQREQRPILEVLAIINDELARMENSDRAILSVAEIDGRIVGFARATYFQPDDKAPVNSCPEGWYLTGVIVDPEFRRAGIASKLTTSRLEQIAEKANQAYYFANAQNRVSIELHEKLGFQEISRDFSYPGVNFVGGQGILFRIDLSGR